MGHTAGTIWYKTQFRNISHRRIRKRTENENFLLSLACTAVIDRKDHVETCRVDEHLAYEMEKKALLKKRSAEEMKPLPTIYDEEASAASAESSTSGQFPEWVTDERLPLWNVHNVNIRTNNHLEGWHNRLNKRASKSHIGLYELLQLLIAEQGVMDTMIQQVLSENATVGDLRRVNIVYAKKQQRVAQYTGEYTNGRRTLEQFLEALMYIKPEAI
ncbi:hypothetical protein T11_10756 [Trichinella zimbabwensis]|uniref:Uncharacterized protein n=2 Tax=Trichinella zimbabwensis TaxID=268475 RepID=A0A0V1H221_9BILA|nr:hypothetical protein T11_10756 [Trichinella zimbabwensis]